MNWENWVNIIWHRKAIHVLLQFFFFFAIEERFKKDQPNLLTDFKLIIIQIPLKVRIVILVTNVTLSLSQIFMQAVNDM